MDASPYAGVNEYIVETILKRRTVRHERQVLVRWRAGWTTHPPGGPFWESEIQVCACVLLSECSCLAAPAVNHPALLAVF